MAQNETPLVMVRRHVREGEGHVSRQTKLIQRLEASNSPFLGDAQTLLISIESVQTEHQIHLDEIEADIRAGVRDVDGVLYNRWTWPSPH